MWKFCDNLRTQDMEIDYSCGDGSIIERRFSIWNIRNLFVWDNEKYFYYENPQTEMMLKSIITNEELNADFGKKLKRSRSSSKKAKKSTLKQIKSEEDAEDTHNRKKIKTEEVWVAPDFQIGQKCIVQHDERDYFIEAKLACFNAAADVFECRAENGQYLFVRRNQIAHFNALDSELCVGLRIVAQMHRKDNQMKSVYKPGIIIEKPSSYNRNRFLILFDTGNFSYEEPQSIRVVYRSNISSPWLDLPASTREFAQTFFENVLNKRKLVKLRVGDKILYTKSGGAFFQGIVCSVDASLAFVSSSNVEENRELSRVYCDELYIHVTVCASPSSTL